MVKSMGPLRAYSTRSMERAIGVISKLVKSKTDAGVNASNIIERLAMRRYVDFFSDIQQELDLIKARPYKPESFWDHPSADPAAPQYWEPFRCGVVATESTVRSDSWSIPTATLYSCLQRFYRHILNGQGVLPPVNMHIDIAARAWIHSTEYSSAFYRHCRQEFRRSNHIVRFYGYNQK